MTTPCTFPPCPVALIRLSCQCVPKFDCTRRPTIYCLFAPVIKCHCHCPVCGIYHIFIVANIARLSCTCSIPYTVVCQLLVPWPKYLFYLVPLLYLFQQILILHLLFIRYILSIQSYYGLAPLYIIVLREKRRTTHPLFSVLAFQISLSDEGEKDHQILSH